LAKFKIADKISCSAFDADHWFKSGDPACKSCLVSDFDDLIDILVSERCLFGDAALRRAANGNATFSESIHDLPPAELPPCLPTTHGPTGAVTGRTQ
jgi:hypothetical protein